MLIRKYKKQGVDRPRKMSKFSLIILLVFFVQTAQSSQCLGVFQEDLPDSLASLPPEELYPILAEIRRGIKFDLKMRRGTDPIYNMVKQSYLATLITDKTRWEKSINELWDCLIENETWHPQPMLRSRIPSHQRKRRHLTREQFQNISLENLRLTWRWLQRYSPWLTKEQFNLIWSMESQFIGPFPFRVCSLTEEMIQLLTQENVQRLNEGALSRFWKWLTDEQASWLTEEQLRWLFVEIKNEKDFFQYEDTRRCF